MTKIALLLLLIPYLSFSQTIQKIFIHDVDNFWTAYDSIRSTTDRQKQLKFIDEFYISKASDGLKAFLKNKDGVNAKWVDLINSDKKFWDSIRAKTLITKTQLNDLEQRITYLNHLYPNLKEAKTYFIIGLRQQGGTIRSNLSIIGTEVVMSEPETDSAEVVRLCIHEYVHTQQVKPDFRNINVLTSSIREGACDFISELVLQKPLSSVYAKYGAKNEVKVWKVFYQDMFTSTNNLWVSTGNNPILPERDLGYYVGYAICKSYYNTAKDKKQAIKDIIDLDYSNQDSVKGFLKKSDYVKLMESRGYKSSEYLKTYGYSSNSNYITFLFSTSDKKVIIDNEGTYQIFNEKKFGDIKSITVAGDFNNWDYKNSILQLAKEKNGEFKLKVARKKLGKAGDKVKFKFVINNIFWVEPKFEIKNRITDNEGNINLYVQL